MMLNEGLMMLNQGFRRRLLSTASPARRTKILCYGDSNTWGFDPAGPPNPQRHPTRLPEHDRWTGRLQQALGHARFHVVDEALNARTTVFDDPTSPCFGQYDCSGRTYLMPCLHSHKPIDLVVLALGTNDMKSYFNASPEAIAGGMAVLVNDIMVSSGTGAAASSPNRKHADGIVPSDSDIPAGPPPPPKVLLLTPPPILETPTCEAWSFGGTAHKALAFPALWEGVAGNAWPSRVGVLHLKDVAEVSPIDGIHFAGGESQRAIAEAVHAKVVEMLSE